MGEEGNGEMLKMGYPQTEKGQRRGRREEETEKRKKEEREKVHCKKGGRERI